MHVWLYAVRATFDVSTRGQLSLADVQPAPCLDPEYLGEPGRSSLLLDSDLLEVKPSTDVVLNGSAHAPGGKAVPSAVVSFRLGAMRKAIRVHGLRTYYRGLTQLVMTPPRPFVRQALSYEWAFGGMDLTSPDPRKRRLEERNPVGKGVAFESASLENQIAHSLEPLDGSRVPVGFGAIDRSWSPRRQWAGTYDASWEEKRKPLLPADYDQRFAQCAPADQQAKLVGGERVELTGLTPEGVLAFDLPRLQLMGTTYFGRAHSEQALSLATVILEPELRKVSLVWQGHLKVRAPDVVLLDATIVSERAA